MNKFPTVYDSPKNAERIKKTYWNIKSKRKINNKKYEKENLIFYKKNINSML